MDELDRAVQAVAAAGPRRITLSSPRAGAPLRRATVRPLGGAGAGAGGWQVERLSETQAFHQNLAAGALAAMLREEFTQLTAVAGGREYSVKISKKGRVLHTSRPLPGGEGRPCSAPKPAGDETADLAQDGAATASHDQVKNRLIPEGADIPPLVDMGVFTAEGRVAAGMQDKYRQISRFVELVADVLPSPAPAHNAPPAAQSAPPLRVVDFGCGKSYLTFILYHYLTRMRGLAVEMTGLDLKAAVVGKCNAAAQKYGYAGLHFEVGDISDYGPPGPAGGKLDMVVTLHACDTATDLALAKAVGWGAGAILSVPCCQHELRGQMASEELAILTRYGIVKERAAALMTDAIRANLLAACGYRAQLLEFVGMEHTPKNIMIRAVKTGQPKSRRKRALAEVERLCAAFALKPCLLELLRESGALPE